MLIFIIPLKSKEVAKSWVNTCQLLERSLRSICSQTDPRFKVIVVCNTKPELQFQHPSIDYIEVDFTIPHSLLEKDLDKGKKVIRGLLHAHQFSPQHVMVVDADDCISCHLTQYVNQHPNSSGWVLNNGYVYQENSRFIYYRKSHFYSWCGTCNIMRFDLCPLPDRDGESYPEELAFYYSGKNHANIKSQLKEKGYSIEALPFVGAVYTIGNGENIYQTGFSRIHNANRGRTLFLLKELLKFRLLTASIRQEFSLYKLD